MRSAIRTVGIALWVIWNLPALVAAVIEEERDAALLAADAGMSVREWRRANRETGL